jgi:hypothetical protein
MSQDHNTPSLFYVGKTSKSSAWSGNHVTKSFSMSLTTEVGCCSPWPSPQNRMKICEEMVIVYFGYRIIGKLLWIIGHFLWVIGHT